jgi:hypothetical protein
MFLYGAISVARGGSRRAGIRESRFETRFRKVGSGETPVGDSSEHPCLCLVLILIGTV